MSLPRLVLCLSLLVSSLGFAQSAEEWTPYTPPASEGTTPPPLVPAPAPSEARPPAPPPAPESAAPHGELIPRDGAPIDEGASSALRLVLTPWAGAVTGLAGLIIGTVPTALLALPFCLDGEGFDERPCAIAAATGLSVSYALGVTAGVALFGGMLDGRGDWVPALMGALAGAALGGGIGAASESLGAFVIAVALAPLFGAVIGYEYSHSQNTLPQGPELRARSGFQVVPVVGATPRGDILGGLAGRF
ncbi:hypothetical protein [Hyalangium gracile]|uniref:hypothetical protein n=1 Tax=Hyalangium gracile TaxID=394092 RepID=UPI001CCF1CBB|nr:hypothetical protein [Hyalangium gracile]